MKIHSKYFLASISDELGYLVDAIVNEDKIDSFDSRPNNMSLEVSKITLPQLSVFT